MCAFSRPGIEASAKPAVICYQQDPPQTKKTSLFFKPCGKSFVGLYAPELEARKRKKKTKGLSAHVHNIVQEVEVHGWLLSGIEELAVRLSTVLIFLTILAN